MAIHFNPVPHGITWTHYRVVASSPDGFDAETVYSMGASFSFKTQAGEATITAISTAVRLVPNQSWVVKGQKTAALLLHESLHYLIATLVGRELESELHEVTGATGAEINTAANDLIAEKNTRALAIGAAYDDDTSHGVDTAQQILWVNRVHDWEHNKNHVVWP